MIIACVLGLVLLRVFYLFGEMYYERDWPRRTWRGLITALVLLLLCASAFAQSAARVDIPLLTSGPYVPLSGGPLPQALWVANSKAYLCAHPSATLGACQASLITTYTDATMGTPCSTSVQLVQLPGNTCVSATGAAANIGAWIAPSSLPFDYWLVSSYGTYGPFTFNPATGSSVGCPITGCTFTGPVNGTSATFSGTVAAGTKASVAGLDITAPNMSTGAKTGSNPNATATINFSADTGNTDRHFFDLRDVSEFDATGGFTPLFFSGTWAAAAGGASYLERVFDWNAPQCNYTVQGYLYYTSSNVANLIGVTPAGTAAGVLTTPYWSVGFSAGNFGWNSAASGWTTLVTSPNLVSGTWYLVTMMGMCNTTGSASNLVVSYARPGTITAGTWIVGTGIPTNTFNMVAESDSSSDLQFGLRYATGTILQPSATVTPGTATYGSVNVPHSETAKMAPWPFQLAVNSNPAGGSVNVYAYVPANYAPTKQAPWFFYSHGSGQSCSQALFGYVGGSNYEPQVLKALVDAGYVGVCTDETNASLQCWGNANCTADIGYAIQTFQMALNLAPRPYVVCESMGGVVCLNAISQGTLPRPLAMVGIYPTYNMTNLYGSATLTAQIQAAYSCGSLGSCQTAWTGYDPSSDSISTFVGIPMDIWCSPSDVTVNCAANGQALVNAVNAAGGTATYNASSGVHGDASNFNPAAVVAFFNAH